MAEQPRALILELAISKMGQAEGPKSMEMRGLSAWLASASPEKKQQFMDEVFSMPGLEEFLIQLYASDELEGPELEKAEELADKLVATAKALAGQTARLEEHEARLKGLETELDKIEASMASFGGSHEPKE